MNLVKTQIIYKGGEPAFAVIPYEKYIKLIDKKIDVTLPQEVVLRLSQGMTLVKAWRKHRGLTQQQISLELGIAQSTYHHFEHSPSPNLGMLRKIAAVLDIEVAQLIE